MIPELSAAFASAKAIKESAKFLADVSKSFDQVELKLKIVELVGQVAELNSELQELRQKLSARESVTYEDGVYWQKGGEKKGDPYCPRCLEANDKLIHMKNETNAYTETYQEFVWQCLDCKTEIKKPDQPPPPEPPGYDMPKVY